MKPYLLLLPLLLWGLLACQPGNEEKNDADAAPLAENEKEAYLKAGRSIAMSTFGALSGQLKAAMDEGGVPQAMQYCHLAAYPLTDSMAQLHAAYLRRTSLQTRNPSNAPTAPEKKMLQAYAQAMAAEEKMGPKVVALGPDSVAFYAPIMMQALCTRCHGTPGEDIAPEHVQLISELYPQDQATGFATGDLRGMWSIHLARR